MNARQEWRNAIRDSDLDGTAKLVALILDTYMNGHGETWPSKTTIGTAASCSPTTAKRAIRRLEQAGFLIVIWSPGGRPNRYVATMPPPPNGVVGDPVNGVVGDPVKPPTGSPEVPNGVVGDPRTRSTEQENPGRSRAQTQKRDPRPLAGAYQPFTDAPPDITVDEVALKQAKAWLSEHRL